MSESVILGPDGKRPARTAEDERCPQCKAGKEKRGPSAGFGVPHPVCQKCGYEWTEEEWHG